MTHRRDSCNRCKRPKILEERGPIDPNQPSIPPPPAGRAVREVPPVRRSPAPPINTKTPTSLKEHFDNLQVSKYHGKAPQISDDKYDDSDVSVSYMRMCILILSKILSRRRGASRSPSSRNLCSPGKRSVTKSTLCMRYALTRSPRTGTLSRQGMHAGYNMVP